MADTDINGRKYAKLSLLKPGDKLEADDGFTCLKKGEIVLVSRAHGIEDPSGLYVPCAGTKSKLQDRRDEHHFLDGQLDFEDNDTLIGFYPL